jgi:hypothetical protein
MGDFYAELSFFLFFQRWINEEDGKIEDTEQGRLSLLGMIMHVALSMRQQLATQNVGLSLYLPNLAVISSSQFQVRNAIYPISVV